MIRSAVFLVVTVWMRTVSGMTESRKKDMCTIACERMTESESCSKCSRLKLLPDCECSICNSCIQEKEEEEETTRRFLLSDECEDLIDYAGTTVSESERLEYLRQMYDKCPDLQGDLDKILPVAKMWADPTVNWIAGSQAMGEEGFLNVDENGMTLSKDVFPDIVILAAAEFKGIEMPIYPPRIDSDRDLYGIWCMYRGRALVWSAIQTGLFSDLYFNEAISLFHDARERFPENDLIRMYQGRDEPEWTDCTDDSNAPQWGNDMHCILTKHSDIVDFWIENIQQTDGSFGGGWNDDVEFNRWWTPLIVAFRHEATTNAWRLFSDGVWQLNRMSPEGYACATPELERQSTGVDVGHTGEESSGTIIPNVITESLRSQSYSSWSDVQNDLWLARAWRIFELFRDDWLQYNDQGKLQHTSTHLKCGADAQNPPLDNFACDVPRHLRALEPVLFLYQILKESCLGLDNCPDWVIGKVQEIEAKFLSWLDAYVDATVSSGDGCKDAGVLPQVLEWKSGKTMTDRGDNRVWFEPYCHDQCVELKDIDDCTFKVCLPSDAYHFPNAAKPMMRAMALVRHLSNDQRYLEPLRSLHHLAKSWEHNKQKKKCRKFYDDYKSRDKDPDRGTAYAIGKEAKGLKDSVGLHRGLQYEVGATAREFTSVLEDMDGTYAKFATIGPGGTGAEDHSAEHGDLPRMDVQRNALSRHFEAVTSEVRYTDRVLELADKYMKKADVVGSQFDDPQTDEFLKINQMLTGDFAERTGGPMPAVRWSSTTTDLPREFAALVLRHTVTTLVSQVYNFKNSAIDITAEFLRLVPGTYQLTLQDVGSSDTWYTTEFSVDCFGEFLCDAANVDFSLPSRTLTLLKVQALFHNDYSSTTNDYSSPPPDSEWLKRWDFKLECKRRYFNRDHTDCHDYNEPNSFLEAQKIADLIDDAHDDRVCPNN